MKRARVERVCKRIYCRWLLSLLAGLGFLFSLQSQAVDSVGTLKFTRGEVAVTAVSGESREVSAGANLMLGERVITGAGGIAVIRLADDSRMVLRPNTEFRVARLNRSGSDSNQSAILDLLRGGLRLVTGLVGRANPSAYRLNTPVATIGIRGTEFNSRLCATDCAAEEARLAGANAAANISEGLYVNVDDGDVFLRNFSLDEALELEEGEAGYVADFSTSPARLDFVPAFQRLDQIPSPSDIDIDDVELSDDLLESLDSAAAAAAAAVAAGASAASSGSTPVIAAGGSSPAGAAAVSSSDGELDVAGTYEIDDISYSASTPLSDRKFFFGANPDIEFELTQEEDRIGGEFSGDRDGRILKGEISGDRIDIEFYLDALGGEIKDGAATWTVQSDGSLVGDFRVRDQQRGVIRGTWTLIRTD